MSQRARLLINLLLCMSQPDHLMINVLFCMSQPARLMINVLLCMSQPARLMINVLLCMQWETFMKLGDDMEDSVVEEKVKAQRPEHCALLVYTVSTILSCRLASAFDCAWTQSPRFTVSSSQVARL